MKSRKTCGRFSRDCQESLERHRATFQLDGQRDGALDKLGSDPWLRIEATANEANQPDRRIRQATPVRPDLLVRRGRNVDWHQLYGRTYPALLGQPYRPARSLVVNGPDVREIVR